MSIAIKNKQDGAEVRGLKPHTDNQQKKLKQNISYPPGPGYSKLTTSLVNFSLKFQTLISQICRYFLLKKCKKLLQCNAKASLIFFNKKIPCVWL